MSWESLDIKVYELIHAGSKIFQCTGIEIQMTNSNPADDLKEVRLATSAYGMHLLGKVLLPDSDPSHAYPEK
jgi:hypothetical protein